MKKLIFLSLFAIVMLSSFGDTTKTYAKTRSVNNWKEFYKFLSNTIKYPEKAKINELQGNNMILFSVTEGKVKDLNIKTELGSGCDVSVLNAILAYPNFKTMKNGKYALNTAFRLHGSISVIENENIQMPTGFIALNISIAAAGPTRNNATNNNAGTSNTFKIMFRGENNFISNTATYGKANPMVILDDKIIEYSEARDIKPNTIQSLEIIKDGAALAQYGNDAINGVIIITSKKQPYKKLNNKTLN